MADEVRVNGGLTIRKLAPDGVTLLVQYTSQPQGFQADMTGSKGPSPGAVGVSLSGTIIDFSQLTRPTFCEIKHLGRQDGASPTDADYLEYGIWDPADRQFHPLGEVLPGEGYPLRLSRNLQEIYVGPGTGTAAAGETARLMLLAHGAALIAQVNAFEY